METMKLRKSAAFKWFSDKTNVEGQVTVFRKENENISKANEAEIHGIRFNFERVSVQQGFVGLFIKGRELAKIFKNIPASDSLIFLKLDHVKSIEEFYNKFSQLENNESETVDSGYGFYMKDTYSNWEKVRKYGFDAIEMTD